MSKTITNKDYEVLIKFMDNQEQLISEGKIDIALIQLQHFKQTMERMKAMDKKEFTKYDIVEIVDFFYDKDDVEYMKIGHQLVGSTAMVIGFYKGDRSVTEYDIEICIFDMHLQELARAYGFDYWDASNLELV